MTKKNGNEPTQNTQPAKGEPAEIPIPTREEVFRDLGKVAKPRKPPPDEISSPEDGEQSKRP